MSFPSPAAQCPRSSSTEFNDVHVRMECQPQEDNPYTLTVVQGGWLGTAELVWLVKGHLIS